MMAGSEVEHSVLLCNFFNSLGKKSFLVLGTGVPEGQTAYVLSVEENGEHWLWNSVTGEHFVAGAGAIFCPLQSVTAVIDDSKEKERLN
jgi:coiled-coil and C2 domain-containing protein 2A